MSKEQLTSREIAERRVRQRHERDRARLIKDRLADRRELVQRHQRELRRLDDLRFRLTEKRKEAFAAHDRAWEQERARLSSRTTTAPLFGLFGPPQRNVQAEYAARRECWEAKREAIRERFDDQSDLIGEQRRSLIERHGLHLISHERWDRLAQDDLKRRQERTFEAAVAKEMRRGERTTSRTFERHARDPGRER